MFSDTEKETIRKSWRLVVPIAETAADLFYRRLFELRPEYRRLFPSEMSGQKRKLIRMLAFIMKSLDWRDSEWRDEIDPMDDLMLVVLAMGRRHTDLYRIPRESYAVVGEALIWTLEQGLADAFTPPTRAAWVKLYTLVAQTMQMGAVAQPAALASTAEEAETQGEAALITQLSDAGIDEARLGLGELS